ncbi:HlyD family type I secretion periplasmic adaptor subunit [Pararhodospirillum oryzae]|uniref:Membrane fusion protein (MFP) family protein n=1 Tax=Pararhodospirillum oryzae TaxID=478448 RepID=A0A512HC35_9PROT|nr:HlyD family type I secretion periplasmic adaptor subunit [Pararhodospirillum oryzae]GEO83011.1 HlyD family type I secretion periplasmic adaptor subunit [Pararhodospirillum oryzae]
MNEFTPPLAPSPEAGSPLPAPTPSPPPSPPSSGRTTRERKAEAGAPPTLDGLLARHPLPTWKGPARVVMVLLAVLIGWASQARLDEVATAPGEVVPEGKTKIIQHLEGGILTDLYVEEGDAVEEGAPLIRLALSTTSMSRPEIEARLDGLALTLARLRAEADGGPLAFPSDVAARRPVLAANESATHQARLSELQSTLKVLAEQKVQRSNEVQELQAQLEAAKASLAITQKRFNISAGLLRDGLTHQLAHLEISAQLEDLKGKIDALTPAIARTEAALGEVLERERETALSFRREARENIGDVEREIVQLKDRLSRAEDQDERTLIRSPAKGIVKNIKHTTHGAVINPGEPIMEIVPVEDVLVVAARLNPVDRGYVTEGQKATVKVTTYDYARYGGLDGTVTLVAPDTTVDEKGLAYYRVMVRTEKTYLGATAGQYEIKPGMEAIVDIHTGTRTVVEYLVRPVLKLRHEAFRER